MSLLLPSSLLAKVLLTAAPCEVSIGETAHDAQLLAELDARALPRRRAPDCIGPSAHVDRENDRFVVRLTEPGGEELERRVLSEEKTVAVLIESWMRDDLALSLLEPVTPPIPVAPPPAPEPASTRAAAESEMMKVDAEPEPDRRASFGLGLGAELAGDLDGNFWFGAAGIVRPWVSDLAPVFVVRVNHNAIAGSTAGTGAARTGAEVLTLLEPRFALGAFSLRPALGAGLGLLHSTRGEDRVCLEGCAPVVEDDFSITNLGPRLEIRLAVAHPVGGDLAIELSASATLSPLAEQDALIPSYASELASPGERALLSLPGEPLLLARASLALIWEAP